MRAEETAEGKRLAEEARREKNWKRWGTYLAERSWGTVREDYSPDGSSWESFPHDHARSRAYRWGEDGLLGFSDRQGRLAFSFALWNGRDSFLKERLFGLAGPEGNHGEDVKEVYHYLDATPTHAYAKALYRYPQGEFPYERLRAENAARGRGAPEFEIADTGVFADGRYFDCLVEYAKAGPEDILVRYTIRNAGPEEARLHLLPTISFRNTWSWGRAGEDHAARPRLAANGKDSVLAEHPTLGRFRFFADGRTEEFLFTQNETNVARLYGGENPAPFVKDAFHERVVGGRSEAANAAREGTRAAAWFRLEIPPGGEAVVRARLVAVGDAPKIPFGADFEKTFARRRAEADEFYAAVLAPDLSPEARRIARQAYAGLLWSKQFYHFSVREWLEGDPAMPAPPPERASGRNADWGHLHAREVIAMPDKWEYPWFAAWDTAFHAVSFAAIDPDFAQKQLVLFLREWYMHPNGQIPAYEFSFSDVNPPVHAWAAWEVYRASAPPGARDRVFLSRVFQKLLLQYGWWTNRKDADGNHLFAGGFLGLDNIGVFDRSSPVPAGGELEQADATAWMAFFCASMLRIALELARENPAYEDIASTFFERFVEIAEAMNRFGGGGLWDEADGFYYDHIRRGAERIPLRVRSMVGLVPLFAAVVLEEETLARLPGFAKRMNWLLENRRELAGAISLGRTRDGAARADRLLAIPSRDRLVRLVERILDEKEFLSPFGIRSLSRVHEAAPFVFRLGGREYRVGYEPGESESGLFGGNSNWRGPVWFPMNILLVEALREYHRFYGDSLHVRGMTLAGAAREIEKRLASLFLPAAREDRPLLFHEYFHAETGRGLGASHQTGWTALVARCLA